MTTTHDNHSKTTGERAQEYDEFTLNTVLEAISSFRRIGATEYEIRLMSHPIIMQKFGISYSETSLENDLDRLLLEGKISVFNKRYTVTGETEI